MVLSLRLDGVGLEVVDVVVVLGTVISPLEDMTAYEGVGAVVVGVVGVGVA